MRRVMNSKLAVPLVILVLLTVLIFALVIRWQTTPEGQAGLQPVMAADEVLGASHSRQRLMSRLAAWVRPTTTDPRAYAIAFGTTIWTYDSTVHSYAQWQDAVTVLRGPAGIAPRRRQGCAQHASVRQPVGGAEGPQRACRTCAM